MKAIFAILFSLFFLLTTMQEATFMLLYKLNEKSITEKYCVNKSKPASTCHGKCHLEKTISASETDNNTNPFSILNLKVKEIEIFFSQVYKIQEITSTDFTSFTQLKSKYFTSIILDGFAFSLIKPPAVLA